VDAVFGVNGPAHPASINAAWSEAKWPFPMDEWGIGKAFVCLQRDCGVRIDVHIRPKIGYCNCTTGVSDDAELERVSDIALLSAKPAPHGRGRAIRIGWMGGMSRIYRSSPGHSGDYLLSIAYNDECDVVVAGARFGHADPTMIEPAVISFLNSNPMVLWAKKELGLEFIRRDW